MKQGKKIITRMLMNNWGGIDHQVIEFNEYVNLFSGKSGSGKSTALDAMQVVLYGSVASDFLNRAADDSANKRNVLNYLRGAQKDGSENRGNQDFYSQIVLEIKDVIHDRYVCIGVSFEVGRGDQDLKHYKLFSHTGKMPDDCYLSEERIPYSLKKIKALVESRQLSTDQLGHINLNRIYPSREAYLNTVHDMVFGYIDPARFKTMQKSAIALRMSKGTSQFIKDYMFPESKEDTISAISEQLGAYREIKEQVEDLHRQIELLENIQAHDLELIKAKADQIKTESMLRILDIEDKNMHLEAKKEDFAKLLDEIKRIDAKSKKIEDDLNEKRNLLASVKAKLMSSDLGQKKHELQQLEEMIQLCGNESKDWRDLMKRIKLWESSEGITDYVSNTVLNMIESMEAGTITQQNIEKLRQGIEEAYKEISKILKDLQDDDKKMSRDYTDKKSMLEDLKDDKKHYRKELKEVRSKLQDGLRTRFQENIRVEIFADLFDVVDEEWRNAIEGRMGRLKYALVVEPQYALVAAKLFREMKKREYESVDLINTAAIQRDKPNAEEGTLYDCVKADAPYVDFCLKRYLGHIKRCESIEELNEVRDGVTKDCYSYSNYIFRHLRQKDYQYQMIGKKVSKKLIRELEEETKSMKHDLIELHMQISQLNPVNELERLKNYDFEKIKQLSSAGTRLESLHKKADRLQGEIKELEEGTRIAQLQKQEEELNIEINELQSVKDKFYEENLQYAKENGRLEDEIKNREEQLMQLSQGFYPNEELKAQVLAVVKDGNVRSFEREQKAMLESLKEKKQEEESARGRARMTFIKAYPSYDFGGIEEDNEVYDRLLMNCKNNYEPKYQEEFDQQYQLVYQMLRENVIATIHSEIKEAKRHRREINSMLSKIKFSDSIYQIDILPTDDENRQFYEMLTAEELDMKVIDREMEGQLSFGEDDFYQKYESQILRLTEKFMPPKDENQSIKENYKKNMQKFADYRTYLKFSMYEKITDEDGNVKKNYVDDMAGRDSGGEGQNPKYVALLAGFAMLYHQQSNRESKIRLVLLDEAFSKMDKERSEVCLHYARKLDLQLIVCVPDERLASLIQNVDCIYAFRRAGNRISMIHIDKGSYLKMIEGDEDDEGSDTGEVSYTENE